MGHAGDDLGKHWCFVCLFGGVVLEVQSLAACSNIWWEIRVIGDEVLAGISWWGTEVDWAMVSSWWIGWPIGTPREA